MKYPKISVITPSFNQGNFIEETILSVLNQNYPNLQYIIIDGGSTDNTVETIRKYQDRLSYWVSEPDKGQYFALQKGLELIDGDVITYINSDDILAAGSFKTVSQIFSDYPDVKWLCGLSAQIDEGGRNINVSPLPKWNRLRYLNNDFKYIQQEGCFWRKELWNAAGSTINCNYHLAADMELWSRFFSYANLYFVNAILGYFRIRQSDQKTLERLSEYNEEALHIISKMPYSEKERKLLNIYNSIVYKYARRISFIKRLPVIENTRKAVEDYPSNFTYDRNNGKFVLYNASPLNE